MDYLAYLLNIFVIFAILSVSLYPLAGLAGQLSVSHAAFFGIGAYVAALASGISGDALEVDLLLSFLSAAGSAFTTGRLIAPMRHDSYVLATFSLQMLVSDLFLNLTFATNGARGIAGIQRGEFLGMGLADSWAFLLLAIAALVVVLASSLAIAHSPLGRLLVAIREDETLAQSLGKDTNRVKRAIYSLSAGFAGLAGGLYAHYFGFIDPSSFAAPMSILILSMVLVGGSGSVIGALAGAAVFVTLPELLRFLGFPAPAVGNMQQIVFAALLLAILVWRPRGITERKDESGS